MFYLGDKVYFYHRVTANKIAGVVDDVYPMIGEHGGYCIKDKDGTNWYVMERELHRVKEEMKVADFSLGDRVSFKMYNQDTKRADIKTGTVTRVVYLMDPALAENARSRISVSLDDGSKIEVPAYVLTKIEEDEKVETLQEMAKRYEEEALVKPGDVCETKDVLKYIAQIPDLGDVIAELRKWAKENPRKFKTYWEEFCEKFPNARELDPEEDSVGCPQTIFHGQTRDNFSCPMEDCKECWNKPIGFFNGEFSDNETLYEVERRYCYNRTCTNCLLGRENWFSCIGDLVKKCPNLEEIIDRIRNWAKENPVKTYWVDFCEKHPGLDGTTNPRDKAVGCPMSIYHGIHNPADSDECYNRRCRECWDAPLGSYKKKEETFENGTA